MAIYYISNAGSNANNGTSTGTSWQTVSKLNSVTLVAGDQVLFKRGDTWVEALTVNQSGSSAVNAITYGAYDTGAKPIITTQDFLTGWSTSGNWTNLGGNIWRINFSGFVDHVQRIWLDGTEYGTATSQGAITSTYRFFYTNGSPDTIAVYATSNPATFYSSIKIASSETAATGHTVSINAKTYINFENLDFQGGAYFNFSLTGASYIKWSYCNMGKYCDNAGLFTNTGTASDNNIVYKCTMDTAATIAYPDTARDASFGATDGIFIYNGNNWVITESTFRGWLHACVHIEANGATYTTNNNLVSKNLMDGSVITYARGWDCFGKFAGKCSNNIFSFNYIKDMKVSTQIGGDYNTFMYNIFDTMTDPNGRGFAYGWIQGLYGGGTYICKFNKCYNNIAYDCAEAGFGVLDLGSNTTPLLEDCENVNNIIYGTANTDYGMVTSSASLISRITIKNNLFYKSGATTWLSYRYNAFSATGMNGQNTNGDVVSGNIAGDPLFTNAAGEDFSLQVGSPALAAGVDLGSLYENALLAASVWPEAITTGVQGALWNIGAYIAGTPVVKLLRNPVTGKLWKNPTTGNLLKKTT